MRDMTQAERTRAIPTLGFNEALREAWSKLTVFEGRSRRSEFWWTYLAVSIANAVLSYIPVIGSLCSFVLWLAMIPLSFRRLHDTGRSGWWYGGGCILGIITFAVMFYYVFSQMAGMGSVPSENEMMGMMIVAFTTPAVLVCLLVALCYGIAMFVFFCQDSEPNANKYGESPKYVL